MPEIIGLLNDRDGINLTPSNITLLPQLGEGVAEDWGRKGVGMDSGWGLML